MPCQSGRQISSWTPSQYRARTPGNRVGQRPRFPPSCVSGHGATSSRHGHSARLSGDRLRSRPTPRRTRGRFLPRFPAVGSRIIGPAWRRWRVWRKRMPASADARRGMGFGDVFMGWTKQGKSGRSVRMSLDLLPEHPRLPGMLQDGIGPLRSCNCLGMPALAVNSEPF